MVLLSISMIITLSFSSLAAESEMAESQVSTESLTKFSVFITDLPNHERSTLHNKSEGNRTIIYKFIDNEGNDITNEFITDITNMSLKEQYELFEQNVSCAIKRTEIITRSGDLSKTVEEEVYHKCRAVTITGASWNQVPSSALEGKVYYRLRGSITYNPNTYKITSATPVLRVNIDWVDWDPDVRPYTKNEYSPSPVIAANGYSATFKYQLNVFANLGGGDMDYVSLGYGSYSDSFKISAD